MFWGYKILDKTWGSVLKLNFVLKSKKGVFLYKVDKKTKFLVRKNTLDKYIIFENWLQQVYTKGAFSINTADTIVDIGAQIGGFSVYAARLAKTGKIYAFEPQPENFNLLKKNKKLNKTRNLYIFNTGVSNKEGSSKLFLSKGNSGGHSIFEADTKNFIVIKTTTLEKIVKKTGKINLLKIDAEGAEYPIILNSKPEVFMKIDRLVLEYHDYLDHGHNFREITKFLQKRGYKVSLGGSPIMRKLFRLGIIKAIK